MGLYEGEGLEKLVEGAETAWHSYKGFGILDEHYFAGKEIVELDVLVVVDIRVVGLLEGEVDVESGRYAFVEVWRLLLPASIMPGPPPVMMPKPSRLFFGRCVR